MQEHQSDIIIARATALASSIHIIKISGLDLSFLIKKFLKISLKKRYAHYTNLYCFLGKILDKAIVIYFCAPKSFTGEDVLELQLHGSYALSELVISEILKFDNVRLAQAGEFSKRAFLNGKIDLSQAEAINSLIAAESQSSLKAALNSYQGGFAKEVNKIAQKIIDLRSLLEANFNFVDDDIEYIQQKNIKLTINNLLANLQNLIIKTKDSTLLNTGVNLLILGKPNVGKSSLFNALLEEKRAIVSNQSGTTRDILKESFLINGLKINLLDSAGIRKGLDEIEKIGINLSLEYIKKANLILYMQDLDCQTSLEDFLKEYKKNIDLSDKKIINVINKIDLQKQNIPKNPDFIYISATKNSNIKILKEKISNIFANNLKNYAFSAKQRHINLLEKSYNDLKAAKNNINEVEICAEDLRLSQLSLNQITGQDITQSVLDNIFSSFCIGK